MKQEKLMEQMHNIRELGLKLVDFAYANQYADMGDMGDIEEMKDTLIQQIQEVFNVDVLKDDYLSTNLIDDSEFNGDIVYSLEVDKERNGNFNLVDFNSKKVYCEFQNNEVGK